MGENREDTEEINYTDKNENYIFDIPIDFKPDEYGLGNFFFNSMRKYRHRIAQYIASTDEEDTYEELLTRCVRVALHLQSRELSKNDIVILCTNNHKNSVVPFIASVFLTLQVASLDPTLSVFDIAHLMKEVKPRILFIIPEVQDVIVKSLDEAEVEAEIVIFGDSDEYTEFSTFIEPHEDEFKFGPIPVESLEQPLVILFSSGTTGLPKGIVLNHYTLLVQGYIIVNSGNISSVNMTYATLYWISAILFLVGSIRAGGARVVCSSFNPDEIWYLIEKYKISSIMLAPSQAIAMIRSGRPDGVDTTSLWNCMIGGAAIPERQLLELRDLLPGAFIFQAYGQSEGGVFTLFNTTDVKQTWFLHNKPQSVGLPVPGVKFKVVDPATDEICGPSQHGELRILSKATMIGYYNKDSSESYDKEGWLRTGDIVYYDEDGCFYIVDRIKEMLKFRSFHVPPAMVEQIIMQHPAVNQTVVIGIPDEEDGDHPMALIIPKPSLNETIDEEEIIAFVSERVPDRMRLRGGIKFLSAFPITPTGKIKRIDLKNMVLRGEL